MHLPDRFGSAQAPPCQEVWNLLLSSIATKLLEEGGFVVFHFDTDSTWSARAGSDNREKFEIRIRSAVKLMLQGAAPPPVGRRFKPLSEPAASAALSRLFIMQPCYSIESWLYQATALTASFCTAVHQKPEHQTQIASWSADRTLLDELERPKDEVLGDCVKDLHNEQLAHEFPATSVYEAGRSWHEFVQQLEKSDELKAALSSSG